MHQPMQGAVTSVETPGRWLSVPELADYLQLTDETVRRLARRRTIPSVTVARRLRFWLPAVLHALENNA